MWIIMGTSAVVLVGPFLIYITFSVPWISMESMESIWISMESIWIPMDIHGYSKVDFGSISYIDIETVIIQNQAFEIGLGQTTPPKMTAMTIG